MAWLGVAPRQLVVLTLVLGLAGCFKSASALIDKADAKYPFTTITLKADDDQLQVIKRDGDVYRLIEDGKEREEPLLLYEIAENLYIIQETPKDGEATYLFAKKNGQQIVFQNDCRGIDADTLKRLKIETRDESKGVFFTCHAADLYALIALGQSPDLWSSETKTLQIVSIE